MYLVKGVGDMQNDGEGDGSFHHTKYQATILQNLWS
jgi:hypothetical protein